ncbi:MAG: hypothetical protein H0X30_01385 [Anaerolineae bacterium]|nr:hypothetical protein [Anaerolineae bacterium]
MSNLPRHGIQAVIEGLPDFLKGMDSINKKISDSAKTTQDAAKKASPLDDALGKVGTTVDGIRDKLKGFVQDSVPFGNQLGGFTDLLVAIPLPALAAVAAIVALGAAFLALGNRGAPLQELGIAFDHLTASVGLTSQSLLKDLRAASEGTIADFDLIRTASTALLGVTGDFGKKLGQSLPEFLKIAKVEADATGRSVNELFNNLVEGVKKGTPKLIENTGLVIEQKAAYQNYAQSLGITVGQLSDTDKSMALLNATLTAGSQAIDTLSGSVESNADKLDRQQATITNTFDGLAIAVQPAFGVVLDATQKVLDIFQQLAQAVGPIFGGIASIIATVFSTVIDIVTAVVQPIVNIISSIAPYFALAFQTVANILGGVGKVIGAIVGQIVTFLKDVAKNFFGLDLDNLGPQLFNGAAAAFGSFANGIISVANKLIFPAVIAIAQFIADFLIGFSPPKEGPLSVIDKGGENIMMAWLDGIAGVSLDPVKQVAKEVSDALGNIGKENLVQVTNRLAQLDKSLLPFQNRLDIIKSQFDALNEPAKAALDAIDRQTAALQDAVAQGDPAAAERLRLLDQQRDAIQGQVDAQQSLVDRSQIQLGLAQAQQAPERALLNIRKAYLDALAKAQPKTSAAGGGAAAPKEHKAAGAGGVNTPAAGGAVPTGKDAGLPSVLDLIGGQDKVDAAAKGINDAFMGAIDQSGLQDLTQNSLDLGGQIDRIKSVDLGSKISDKFKGLTDAFNPQVAGSVANKIFIFFNGDASVDGSFASLLAHAGDVIEPIINDLKTNIGVLFASIFDPTVEGSPANIISVLTAGADVEGSAAFLFAQLPQNISDAASGLLDLLKKDIFDPVTTFLTGTTPGTLGGIINDAANLFTALGPGIVGALQNFGGMVYNAIVVPVINVMNAAIGALESAIDGIAKTFAGFLGNIIGTFDNAKIGDTNLGGLVPQALRDFQSGLANSNFKIARISTDLPAFLQPPAGAKGGLFGEGLFKVGEKGPEYLFSGQKFGVLPNQLVSVLSSLSSVLAQPAPMALPAGGNTSNTSNSSFTFNGIQSDSSARQRYNTLRAGMR